MILQTREILWIPNEKGKSLRLNRLSKGVTATVITRTRTPGLLQLGFLVHDQWMSHHHHSNGAASNASSPTSNTNVL